MSGRDHFDQGTKTLLARRVAFRCSNPDCGAPTIGPGIADTAVSVGVAAHITAASRGGPRFDEGLTGEQRRHGNNGIWLCQTCSRRVDVDAARFPEALLRGWKDRAIEQANRQLGRALSRTIAPPAWREVVAKINTWNQQAISDEPESRAKLGQIVNPGDPNLSCRVDRHRLVAAIADTISSDQGGIVLVEGEEGAGKTWATFEAAASLGADDRLVLLVPASRDDGSALDVLLASLLAERLGGPLDAWQSALTEWQGGPAEQSDKRLIVVFDGLNEAELTDWRARLAQASQARWQGRLRLVFTARPRHTRMIEQALPSSAPTPAKLVVSGFNDEELAIALAQVQRADIRIEDASPSLQRLLRTPRFFQIAATLWDEARQWDEVSAHRLYLEDLRQRYGDQRGQLDPDGWAAFLSELGASLGGQPRILDPIALRNALSGAGLSPDRIEKELKEIESGRLFVEIAPKRFVLSDEMAPLASGMAVVTAMAAGRCMTISDALDRLEQVLPDHGADARTEILRAAVLIVLTWTIAGSTEVVRVALLVAWLSARNSSANHGAEARAFAAPHVPIYLDAYETIAASPLPDRSALRVLSEALSELDVERLELELLRRATRWAGYVGMRDAFLSGDDGEERGARTRRFIETLGEAAAAGPRILLGARLEFLPGWDPAFLLELAARVFHRKPLADKLELFRTAAVAVSVGARDGGWKSLKRLARFNRADAEDLDAALLSEARKLTHAVASGTPLHRVSQSAAMRLFDLVSGQALEQEMTALTDAVSPTWRTLLEEYTRDPATSHVALEARHAPAVAARGDLEVYRRISRLKDHLWDPDIDFGPAFAHDVAIYAEVEWSPAALSASRGRSRADIDFELIDVALARVRPKTLGDQARDFADHVVERAQGSFHSGLWRVRSQGVALDAERAARLEQRLRRSSAELDGFDLQILFGIIAPRRTPAEQIQLLANHGRGQISRDLGDALAPPSHDEALRALTKNETNRDHVTGVLAHLALSDYAPTEVVATLLLGHATSPDTLHAAVAMDVLAAAPTEALARELVARDWRWDPQRPIESFYGSIILVRGGPNLPFAELIDRICPGLLAWAVQMRGGVLEEIEACAQVFCAALNVPRPAGRTVGPNLETADPEDRGLKGAVDRAIVRLDQPDNDHAAAWSSMTFEGVTHFGAHLQAMAGYLLDSPKRLTRRSRRRGRLVLWICKALLESDPGLGARLWRAENMDRAPAWLIGDLYLQILFAARPSAERDELIQEIWSQIDGTTDAGLFALVMAAETAGAGVVLESLIDADLASSRAYRHARAWQAKSFRVESPVDEAQRGEREPKSWVTRVRKAGAERTARNAAAKHWYRQFATADDPDEALAGWELLLRVVDSRFRLWRERVDEGNLSPVRRAHLHANENELKRAVDKNEKRLQSTFLEEPI